MIMHTCTDSCPALFFVFPAGLGGSLGSFLSACRCHGFHAAFPSDLAAFAAHFGHDTGEGFAVYLRFFGGGEGYNCGCNLIRVFKVLANTLWHTDMMPRETGGRQYGPKSK